MTLLSYKAERAFAPFFAAASVDWISAQFRNTITPVQLMRKHVWVYVELVEHGQKASWALCREAAVA